MLGLGLGLALELCSWRVTVHEIHSPKEPSHGAYVRAYTGMCVWYEIMRGTSFHSRAMYVVMYGMKPGDVTCRLGSWFG